MKAHASVVSGVALASLAVVTPSVVSSEDTVAGSSWTPVGRLNSRKLSNMDGTAVSENKQGVVVSNYYQILEKDLRP